ncbi:hypothetical protein HK104_009286 [Borealophlyctis nickersoniae]|nr:hypothetical protein HK104_009286 [Borealophlyctis nickersoniae]
MSPPSTPVKRTLQTPTRPLARGAFKTPTRTAPFRSPVIGRSKPSPASPTRTPASSMRSSASSPLNKPFRSPARAGQQARLEPVSSANEHPEVSSLMEERKKLEKSVEELENRNRKLRLMAKYIGNDEPAKVDALVEKWRGVACEALTRFRDNVGPVSVVAPETAPSNWGFGGSEGSSTYNDTNEQWLAASAPPRSLTLKEMAERLKIDPAMFGEYNEDRDSFE